MASLAQAVDRISRIGGWWNWALALAGLGGLYAALLLLENAFAPAPPARAAGAAFHVANPAGKRIGTLAIDYPRRLRENQDSEIRVRYEAEAAWRDQFAAAAGRAAAPRPTLKLSVHLAATRLVLEPPPPSYDFDNARILAGGDGRSWILSPRQEGDYVLLARLHVEPAGFRAIPVAANRQDLGRAGTVSLPVTVVTRYSVPQVAVDLGKAAASLLAFLLTLPFAASLVKRWLGAPPPAEPSA